MLVRRPETTTVNGEIPIDERDHFQQHRGDRPTPLIWFGVTMQTEGIGAGVDYKPTPAWNLGYLKLVSGPHRVVLGIAQVRIREGFRILIRGDSAPSVQGCE